LTFSGTAFDPVWLDVSEITRCSATALKAHRASEFHYRAGVGWGRAGGLDVHVWNCTLAPQGVIPCEMAPGGWACMRSGGDTTRLPWTSLRRRSNPFVPFIATAMENTLNPGARKSGD
jgi:hypothetical protein